jgi:hypothetical protein
MQLHSPVGKLLLALALAACTPSGVTSGKPVRLSLAVGMSDDCCTAGLLGSRAVFGMRTQPCAAPHQTKVYENENRNCPW